MKRLVLYINEEVKRRENILHFFICLSGALVYIDGENTPGIIQHIKFKHSGLSILILHNKNGESQLITKRLDQLQIDQSEIKKINNLK